MTRSKALHLTAFRRAVWPVRWIALAVLLGWCVFAGPVPGWAQGVRPRFEVKNYVIDAELLSSQHLLTATAHIDLVPDTDITTLAFQLHSNLRVTKVVDAAGQEVSFRQDGLALNLSLLNPMSAGKQTSITVSYGGLLGIRRRKPGGRYKSSIRGPGWLLPALPRLLVPGQPQ